MSSTNALETLVNPQNLISRSAIDVEIRVPFRLQKQGQCILKVGEHEIATGRHAEIKDFTHITSEFFHTKCWRFFPGDTTRDLSEEIYGDREFELYFHRHNIIDHRSVLRECRHGGHGTDPQFKITLSELSRPAGSGRSYSQDAHFREDLTAKMHSNENKYPDSHVHWGIPKEIEVISNGTTISWKRNVRSGNTTVRDAQGKKRKGYLALVYSARVQPKTPLWLHFIAVCFWDLRYQLDAGKGVAEKEASSQFGGEEPEGVAGPSNEMEGVQRSLRSESPVDPTTLTTLAGTEVEIRVPYFPDYSCCILKIKGREMAVGKPRVNYDESEYKKRFFHQREWLFYYGDSEDRDTSHNTRQYDMRFHRQFHTDQKSVLRVYERDQQGTLKIRQHLVTLTPVHSSNPSEVLFDAVMLNDLRARTHSSPRFVSGSRLDHARPSLIEVTHGGAALDWEVHQKGKVQRTDPETKAKTSIRQYMVYTAEVPEKTPLWSHFLAVSFCVLRFQFDSGLGLAQKDTSSESGGEGSEGVAESSFHAMQDVQSG
ncbi:MAG: hypothetical protein Q9162_001794 [Coniocarpon cinnabarinum]